MDFVIYIWHNCCIWSTNFEQHGHSIFDVAHYPRIRLVKLRELANEVSQIFIRFLRPYSTVQVTTKERESASHWNNILLQFGSDIGGIRCTLRKRTARLQEHKAHLGENEGISRAVSLPYLLFRERTHAHTHTHYARFKVSVSEGFLSENSKLPSIHTLRSSRL